MHVVMAKDASKPKQKHRKFSQKNKKQIKETKPTTQPRLPKTASEVSSNWKALAAVCIFDNFDCIDRGPVASWSVILNAF